MNDITQLTDFAHLHNPTKLQDESLFFRSGETIREDFGLRRLSLDFGHAIQVQIIYPDEGSYAGCIYTDEHYEEIRKKMLELAILVYGNYAPLPPAAAARLNQQGDQQCLTPALSR